MFAEDELLPLSALQHLLFCERQCALIHIERVWADNALTVEGSYQHRKVDETGPRSEARGDLRISRGLALVSRRLGLVGRADVVEFHRQAPPAGVALPGVEGSWRPFPVEHKRGRPKRDRSDEVQICAQALCLEEMLGAEVPEGALFYGARRRRFAVTFDDALRGTTEEAAARLRRLISTGSTPRAVREKKCERCSMLELCMPDAMSTERSARSYLERALVGEEESRS